MGMTPVAYCLWQQFLRFDPEDPIGRIAITHLKELQKKFGFTLEGVAAIAQDPLSQRSRPSGLREEYRWAPSA